MKKKQQPVYHLISDIPNPADLPQFDYITDSTQIIMRTDSTKRKKLKRNLIIFIILTFFGIISTLDVGNSTGSYDFIGIAIFIIFPFILLSLGSIKTIRSGEEIAYLNRKTGTVTMPCGFWRKTITVPFEETTPYFGGYPFHLGLRIIGKGKGIMLSSWKNLAGEWAFFVWYMDRNRPLPPGNVFDKYRKEDAARLRKEGYPQPKYPMTPQVKDQMEPYIHYALNTDIVELKK